MPAALTPGANAASTASRSMEDISARGAATIAQEALDRVMESADALYVARQDHRHRY